MLACKDIGKLDVWARKVERFVCVGVGSEVLDMLGCAHLFCKDSGAFV